MSYFSDLDLQLTAISDIETQLIHELQQAQATLNRLLCNREGLIRLLNRNKWDFSQYQLDDLQQELAEISEKLEEIAPVDSIVFNLLAP